MYDTVIIGAGITGLTAAYRLASLNRPVLVIDKAPDPGGKIQTIRRDGYLLECGPTTFPAGAQALWSLCDDLGLQPLEASPTARYRYIYYRGRLNRVPTDPWAMVTSPLLSPAGKLRLLLEPFQPQGNPVDETIAQFARRRLGPEVLKNLLAPFLSGVYAGDPEQLSIEAVFPRLAEWEMLHGSLVKGAFASRRQKRTSPSNQTPGQKRHALYSFSQGMRALPEALARKLPQDALAFGIAVESIRFNAPGFTLDLSDGREVTARSLLMATPAWLTAGLIHNIQPEIAHELSQIHYVPLSVVHMGFEKRDIAHRLNGFGYLVARPANVQLLGSLWTSSIFPDRAPQNHVLITSFMGGAVFPHLAALGDDHMQAQVLADLERIFPGSQMKPRFVEIIRHDQAIPQYHLGHRQRVSRVLDGLKQVPGLFLAGNYLQGIALNECVRQANDAAQSIDAYLKDVWAGGGGRALGADSAAYTR